MKDRRQLLKGLAIGSVWSAPVVSSVMIPAHGATTCGELEVRCFTRDDCEMLVDCDFDDDCMRERYCLERPSTGEILCLRVPCLIGLPI